ncbi:MAG: hypothetical protein ACREGI_03590 [Candidatus Levyibacteriota bacterium]
MRKILDSTSITFFVALGILGTLGIVTSLICVNFNNKLIVSFTAIFLYLTLVAVLWYSWETRQLKIETRRLRKWAADENHVLKKQSITSIRPYLRLQTIEGIDNKLRLVNEGKGVAISLKLRYLKKGKEINRYAVTAMASAPGSFTDIHRNEITLNPEDDYSMEIAYKDIEDRKYIAIFEPNLIFNDNFEILKQEENNEQ